MKPSNRREVIKQIALGSVAMGSLGTLSSFMPNDETSFAGKLKGNIKHSVCRWTYAHLSLEALCNSVKKIGFSAIDLVGPKEWNILKTHGVDSSMCNGAEISLVQGFNDPQFHTTLETNYLEHIELVQKAGYKNLICFSGNRNGMDDDTGLKNCVTGLKRIIGAAEKAGVTIQMELFNSRVDHKDYMADKSAWGIDLCKRLGSPNFKLLYDIYHMQINEGDIIRSINNNHEYFGHYHTAGVPGRHEIDETQELFYPAIMHEIVKIGHTGYVAQEFIPTGADENAKFKALKKAVETCDV